MIRKFFKSKFAFSKTFAIIIIIILSVSTSGLAYFAVVQPGNRSHGESISQSPTPTAEPTTTPTTNPTVSPTISPTPTYSPNNTPSPSPAPTPNPTPSPTPSPTATPSPTPSPKPAENLDSDNDGVSNEIELIIGTNTNNPNTDGDRYDDYMEYNNEDPSYVKNPGRSPLNPAYPDLRIQLSNSYKIYLEEVITTEQGNVLTQSHDYSFETCETVTTNYTNKLEVEVGYNMMWYGSVKDTFDYSNTNTLVTKSNSRYLFANAESWSTAVTRDLGNSYLSLTMRIKNVGSDILLSEPSDIWINLYVGTESDPRVTWNFASNYQGGKIAALQPDEIRTVNIKFEHWLTTDILKQIDCGEPIRFEVQKYDIGNDRTYLQNAEDKAIRLDIDNSTHTTTGYFGEDNIKLVDFLKKYANLVMDGSNVQSIAGLQCNESSWWEIILPEKSQAPNNILDVTMIKGDHICLLYQKHSDNDGIIDREEIMIGTNPFSNDTDSDGVSDFDEIYGQFGTDPKIPDTDFDRLYDGEELSIGVDGYITNATKVDSDSDGLNDYDEIKKLTNPTNPDSDSDGLADGTEVYTTKTDPKAFDSDFDGLNDGQEVNQYSTDPLKADTDNDGLNDKQETVIGSNPKDPDTDKDHFYDGVDSDPLRDIYLNVNLVKMMANNTGDEFWTNELDVSFKVTIGDSYSWFFNDTHNCPENTNIYPMNKVFSYNVPDNDTVIFIKIDSFDRDLLGDEILDVSGGKMVSDDLNYAMFAYNLVSDTWQEMYGADPSALGKISGLDDGIIQGGQITLWYSLYTNK